MQDADRSTTTIRQKRSGFYFPKQRAQPPHFFDDGCLALPVSLPCISNSTAQHKHAINQPAVATFDHLVYHGIMLQATMRQPEAKVSIAKANHERSLLARSRSESLSRQEVAIAVSTSFQSAAKEAIKQKKTKSKQERA
jgi:hypothetical protein